MMIEKVTSLPPNQRHSFFLTFSRHVMNLEKKKNRRRERITEQDHENCGRGVLFGLIEEKQTNGGNLTHQARDTFKIQNSKILVEKAF